jgi:hypothetical protein
MASYISYISSMASVAVFGHISTANAGVQAGATSIDSMDSMAVVAASAAQQSASHEVRTHVIELLPVLDWLLHSRQTITAACSLLLPCSLVLIQCSICADRQHDGQC